MKIRIVILAALLFFVSTAESTAQTSTPSPIPTPTPPVDVMYTGKLFGYFRVPSLQNFNQGKGCPATSDADSIAAQRFLKHRQDNKAILVGMGDNFAPQLEARVFNNPPKTPDKYPVGNKELYYGTKDGWEFYDTADGKLLAEIAAGRGTIPTDNVACFLRAARFDAIVPGKHDFYFGPERVRQLARLLASDRSKENDYKPVQMLGANLVLKTVRIDNASAPKVKQPGVGDWPGKDYSVLNLKEGNSVYPWLAQVRIESGNPNLDGKQLSLCASPRAPNELEQSTQCTKLDNPQVTPAKEKYVLTYNLPPLKLGKKAKGSHFSTLMPGTNYGLCIEPKSPPGTPQKFTRQCLLFSTHIPFFYSPHPAPLKDEDGYTDPDPFVLIEDRVAIFGVVDPNLAAQVGVLNFGWTNEQRDLTTRVSVEDPAEALLQQLEYFDYLQGLQKKKFSGLKILLAQMTPQRARALATRFSKQFQIVVSGADDEQTTSEVPMSTTWHSTKHPRPFVAVPAPYVDSPELEGSVHFGIVKATAPDSATWVLKTLDESAQGFIKPVPVPFGDKTHDALNKAFWERIIAMPGCLPANSSGAAPLQQEALKLLVLCAMRDYTSADVALIQSRDLYNKIPAPDTRLLPRSLPPDNKTVVLSDIQQMLDRLIWKGDLITLLYVPGRDLKSALKRSDAYLAEQNASLSLSVDSGRQLERLGVKNEGGEYIINGLPLDESKIYTVATTDYIEAGDTGYPDLAKAALNPRTHPAAFTGDLRAISSLVCRKLVAPDEALKYCLPPLNSDKYLDQSSAKQIPTYKRPGFLKKIWDSLDLEWPEAGTSATNHAAAVEQRVQRREIWTLSLQNFTFGFKTLNNNLSDSEIQEKFGGISTSGVTTGESHTFNVTLDTKLSRSSHKREFYIGTGIDYKRQSIGDEPTEFQISQITNRLFGESGLVLWRRPGRSWPNVGINVSLYGESQLQRPYSIFTLASKDQLKISQDRSLLLLPRLGFRWQNKKNYFEFGVQGGREIDALGGYRFVTNGVVVECLASSAQSFKSCVSSNSSITTESEITPLLADRPRAGAYWRSNFAVSLPFTSKVKYELEEQGDWFFVNFSQDTSVDTRIRYISRHRLSFMIWPSVSIGPTWDLLLYQNKVNRDFLFQRQFGIETKVSFDIFNRREKGVQLKHKP